MIRCLKAIVRRIIGPIRWRLQAAQLKWQWSRLSEAEQTAFIRDLYTSGELVELEAQLIAGNRTPTAEDRRRAAANLAFLAGKTDRRTPRGLQ